MTLYGIVSEMNNKAEIKTNKIPSTLRAEQAAKPDHLKRIAGVGLTLIGGIGCVVTSPLLLLGGGLGLITGMFWQSNLWESGLQGAKIGSLGAIFTMLLGIEFAQATINAEEEQPLLIKEQSDPEAGTPLIAPATKDNTSSITELVSPIQSTPIQSTLNTEAEKVSPESSHTPTLPASPSIKDVKEPASSPVPFFPPPLSKHRSIRSFDFKKAEEVEAFTTTLEKLVAENNSKAQSRIVDNTSRVSEAYLIKLVEVTTTSLSSDDEFWGRLEQMSNQDIKTFAAKLNSNKTGTSVRVSSELDCLWRRFKGVQFELSKQEDRRNKFAVMLEALSTEQLQAAFNSADFLSIMNQDIYVETAANTLTSEQLKIFASINTKQDILNLMIKKMKPDELLLGKLAAILPHATETVKSALLDQISHLPYPASFNIELAKLAEHHIYENHPVRRRMRQAEEEIVLVQPAM